MYKILLVVLIFGTLTVSAQDIRSRGSFLEDSIKVGEPIFFSLSASYSRELDVVFPDSTFNFAPFEFEKKEYFPTQTDSLFSYDSAVYTLITFEVDSVQYLRLPVFQVTADDSIAYFTTSDSIILQHVVEDVPNPDTVALENIPLKENPSYLPVVFQFNYPYVIIGIIVLVILVLLVLIIFGKRIKKWWKLRRLEKKYQAFRANYHQIVTDSTKPAEQQAHDAEILWKKFVERITNLPYTKLTTKEIYLMERDEELLKALKELDRIIYSGRKDVREVSQAYNRLEINASNRYDQIVKEIKHE